MVIIVLANQSPEYGWAERRTFFATVGPRTVQNVIRKGFSAYLFMPQLVPWKWLPASF